MSTKADFGVFYFRPLTMVIKMHVKPKLVGISITMNTVKRRSIQSWRSIRYFLSHFFFNYDLIFVCYDFPGSCQGILYDWIYRFSHKSSTYLAGTTILFRVASKASHLILFQNSAFSIDFAMFFRVASKASKSYPQFIAFSQ